MSTMTLQAGAVVRSQTRARRTIGLLPAVIYTGGSPLPTGPYVPPYLINAPPATLPQSSSGTSGGSSGGGGGNASGAAIGIINALGNIISSTTRGVTGNYPPTQQTYYPATAYQPQRDANGNIISSSVAQTAGDLSTVIQRNLGTIVVVVAAVMLFKSGRGGGR